MGEVQVVMPRFTRVHLNEVASGEGLENWIVTELVLTKPAGARVITVSGGVPSTVHVTDAGVGSTLPAMSMARALNVCKPSASPVYDSSGRQLVHAAPSRLHWYVTLSFEKNEKVAVDPVRAGGFTKNAVSGGVASTVHVRVAGVPSVFPAVSTARTWNEWSEVPNPV